MPTKKQAIRIAFFNEMSQICAKGAFNNIEPAGSKMTVTPGKQRAKREAAREKICLATIKCLSELGYAETSIQRVITAANLSKGALQHHFPSKQDLMAATAERILANAALSPAIAAERNQPSRDVKTEVLEIWRKYVNTNEYRALLEILIAIRTDADLQERLSPLLKDWEKNRLASTLRQYQSEDGDDDEVLILMTMTTSLMRGLIVQGQYSEDPAFNERVIKYWLDFIGSRLKPRP